MHRCLAQLSITIGGRTEHLWPGLEVNLDRALAPGFTLRDAIAGREDCFDAVGASVIEADNSDAPIADAAAREE